MLPQIRAAIDRNRLPHASLIAGATDAREMAAAFNCLSEQRRPCGVCLPCVKLSGGNHPDVFEIDCTQAKIEQIRAVVTESQTLPNEGRNKVFLLYDADALSPVCQNALLKTLEEPQGGSVYILTADKPSRLLPTVLSRLTMWSAGAAEKVDANRALSDEILSAYDSANELKLLLSLLSCDKLARDEMGALIDALRDGLLERRALEAVEKLGAIRITLERNTGIGHVAGAIAATLAKEI